MNLIKSLTDTLLHDKCFAIKESIINVWQGSGQNWVGFVHLSAETSG